MYILYLERYVQKIIGFPICVKVWDVSKGEPLYNFRGHSSRVMCVVWSYLDADLVYSGGEDGTVRPWRPSLQQYRQPPVSGGVKLFTVPYFHVCLSDLIVEFVYSELPS